MPTLYYNPGAGGYGGGYGMAAEAAANAARIHAYTRASEAAARKAAQAAEAQRSATAVRNYQVQTQSYKAAKATSLQRNTTIKQEIENEKNRKITVSLEIQTLMNASIDQLRERFAVKSPESVTGNPTESNETQSGKTWVDEDHPLCFTGDTPVQVQDDSKAGYHSQPISSIRKGDVVISCNLEVDGGTCEFGHVQALVQSKTNRLVKITIGGKTLRSTENHPIYAVDRHGWVKAEDLRAGDHLSSISGEVIKVDDVEVEKGSFTVFNLDVQGNHNYYACDILVHNCNILAAGSLAVAETAGTALGAGAIVAAVPAAAFVGSAAVVGYALHKATEPSETDSSSAHGKLLQQLKQRIHELENGFQRHAQVLTEDHLAVEGTPSVGMSGEGSSDAAREDSPKINQQKQAGHIKDTPQYNNRIKQGKVTSSWDTGNNPDELTIEAWKKGTPVPGRPQMKEYDFGRQVGTSSNGNPLTKVRVSQDGGGEIHGHPR